MTTPEQGFNAGEQGFNVGVEAAAIEGKAFVVTQDGIPFSMWLTKSAATKIRDCCRRQTPNARWDISTVVFRSLKLPETAPASTCICPRCSATIIGEMTGPEDETAPAGDAGSLAEFAPGGAYDAESHVRFLRDQGGGSAGYTADLIEKLYHALRAAPQWRTDMENAPKDITLRLWVGGVERHGKWNDDRYASSMPHPFWSYHGQTKTYSRANPPTHWSLIVGPLPSVQGGE